MAAPLATAERARVTREVFVHLAQGLVELACECTKIDCERFVKVPLYVYRRMLDSDQYLLQAGHHAFAQYRTIVSVGLMRIEEKA